MNKNLINEYFWIGHRVKNGVLNVPIAKIPNTEKPCDFRFLEPNKTGGSAGVV